MNTDLLSPQTFKRVLNRAQDMSDIVTTLREHWEYDLDSQRPGPAILANGDVKATDLDMACLLATLAKRRAVVILPKYSSDSTTKSAANPNQTLISSDNRRGKLLRLQSHQEYFSFSMLVQDMNVIDNTTGELGAPRAFNVLGKDGRFHPGWSEIRFVPEAKENAFIKKYGLDVAGRVPFNRFVSEDRWTAFYGQYYFLTKAVEQRLEEEAKAIRAAIKAQKSKEEAPTSGKPSFERSDDETSFPTRKLLVPVFEAEIDAPFHGDIAPATANAAVLKEMLTSREEALRDLRFATRATELAFYKVNGKAGGPERAGIPAWAQGAQWEDHRIARTTWRRLSYGKLAAGQPDVALRYRIRAKEIEVAHRLSQ